MFEPSCRRTPQRSCSSCSFRSCLALEREEHKATTTHYAFGGVRTFPLIGLTGFALALLAGGQLVVVAIGFAVVGAFLTVSYHHKLKVTEDDRCHDRDLGAADIPAGRADRVRALLDCGHARRREPSALGTARGAALAGTADPDPRRFFTFTKFLLLAGVVLPILPNEELTLLHVNPFQTWVVVVAVSAISYASYALQKVARGRGGVLLAAVLGGSYSSTITTVALARQSRQTDRPSLFAGAILLSSAVMYVRIVVLVALFNSALALRLAGPFLALAVLGVVVGYLYARRRGGSAGDQPAAPTSSNPLELRSALLFAVLFVVVVALTRLAQRHLGAGGIYGLAAIMGVADVDPFILGMAHSSGTAAPVAAAAIAVAAATNNLAKGVYAFAFGGTRARLPSLILMTAFTVLGLIPSAFGCDPERRPTRAFVARPNASATIFCASATMASRCALSRNDSGIDLADVFRTRLAARCKPLHSPPRP